MTDSTTTNEVQGTFPFWGACLLATVTTFIAMGLIFWAYVSFKAGLVAGALFALSILTTLLGARAWDAFDKWRAAG